MASPLFQARELAQSILSVFYKEYQFVIFTIIVIILMEWESLWKAMQLKSQTRL